MANAVIEVVGLPTGLALTVDLYPWGSDVAAASGIALTERTNAKTIYRGTTAAALTGWHRCLVKSGTDVLAVYDVMMTDEAVDHYAHDEAIDIETRTEETGVPTTPRGWLRWLTQRFRRAKFSSAGIQVKTAAGAVATTQAATNAGGIQEVGPPA